MTQTFGSFKQTNNYSTDHSQRQFSQSSNGSLDSIHGAIDNSSMKSLGSRHDLHGQRSYQTQLKRQMCKNFANGYCKYKDHCSFSHIRRQDLGQVARPCKRYFTDMCPFGDRCNNLHYDLVNLEEHRDFVERVFRDQKLMVPIHPKKLIPGERNDIQRFQHLYKIFGRKLEFKRDDLQINICRRRLDFFETFTSEFEQLLMSADNSRKVSANMLE